jgi:Flp pilus assembly protein TadG
MAVFLSNGVVVTLASVDLSDHVTSATINRVFEELEVTAMGDSSRRYAKGLETSTVTLDFLNDTAAGEVLQTLQSNWGTTVALTLKQNSGPIATTNPEYQTTVLVNNTTDINGAVGDISTQSITFTCNSVIVVDVTP